MVHANKTFFIVFNAVESQTNDQPNTGANVAHLQTITLPFLLCFYVKIKTFGCTLLVFAFVFVLGHRSH